MLVVLYHPSGVEIEGTADELQDLSATMKQCSNVCDVLLGAPAEFDERGLRYLMTIEFTVRPGPLVVSVLDRMLLIAGAREKLDLLSENVDSLLDPDNEEGSGDSGGHIHVEYYPGHFFLSEDALPLIFELRC